MENKQFWILCSVNLAISLILILFNPSIQRALTFAAIDILTLLIVVFIKNKNDDFLGN